MASQRTGGVLRPRPSAGEPADGLVDGGRDLWPGGPVLAEPDVDRRELRVELE